MKLTQYCKSTMLQFLKKGWIPSMVIFLSPSALKNALLVGPRLPILPHDAANVSMPGGPCCSPPKSGNKKLVEPEGKQGPEASMESTLCLTPFGYLWV